MQDTLLLSLIAVTLRYLVVRYADIESDTYGHLYFAKALKEQGAGPFGQIVTKVVGSTGYRAPFLWHWLIGFFPLSGVLRIQKWINPGLDALFALVIYLTALAIDFTQRTASLMAVSYLFTPMWFSRLSIGPRLASLTPRLTSELATNLFFIITVIPHGIHPFLSLTLGAILAAFVLLSSKFGLQAMFLLVPLTSLIALDPQPLIAITLGIIIAVGISKGTFLEAGRAQLDHLAWYFRKNLKGEMWISNRNDLGKLLGKRLSDQDFRSYLANLLNRLISYNSYTAVLIKMPVLCLALALYTYTLLNGTYQPPLYMIAPVIAASLVFLLINWPPLLFLGEAERYLNHVAFFIVGMVSLLITSVFTLWQIWLIVIYGCIFWFVESFFLHKMLPKSRGLLKAANDRIINHLNSLDRSVVVLSYPYESVGVWRIMLETRHRVVYGHTVSKEYASKFSRDFEADYPYVDLKRLDKMAQELSVTYLIVHKKSLIERGIENWEPPSEWLRLNLGGPIYNVYRRMPTP
jgi:hypothetical protein